MARRHNVLALILGGGAGTRLFPLTWQRSKPAVPLGGKYRLVDIPISNCINSDITKIFVLTQYNSASLNRHVARTYRFSQFSDGFVDILAAEQTPDSPQWFQGTADAVRQVLPHIRDWQIEHIIILSGDHLYTMDYRDFLQLHYETEADVSVSVIPCRPDEASEFGLLKTNRNGRIVEFKEKPKGDDLEAMRVNTALFGLSKEEAEKRPFLASMGIYIFRYDRLEELLTENPNWVDFGREVIPAAIKDYKVQGYLFDGYWEDIGTIKAFYEANLEMASIIPQFNLFNGDTPIYTRARYLPPSKIHNCEIRDSVISEGCILNGALITRSIVGLRCRVGHGSKIESTILMGADYYESLDGMEENRKAGLPLLGVGENTIIRRAILDKNARIGSNVRIINERNVENEDGPEGMYYIRDGIVIVPKKSIIPNGAVI
jgi:glucose-1-phosphate adenylyltransferase